MRESVLKGNLRALVLPDVLGFVSMVKKTGELAFRRAGATKTVFWEDGEITFASSSDPNDSLGAFFVRNGVITEADNRRALSMVTPEQRQGKILVQMGLIQPKELWWGVKHQVLEIIYSLFTWQDGEFELIETDEVRGERISLNVSTTNIILEGVRRLDEWARIRTRIPSRDMLLERAKDADAEGIELNESEREVYRRVNGKRTVHDIIVASGQGEFETLKNVFSLLTADLVRSKDRPRLHREGDDADDTEALKRVVDVYNRIFGHIYAEARRAGNGEVGGVETAFSGFFESLSGDPNNLFHGVRFDGEGRLDERTLFANIAEVAASERSSVLDRALNDLLSYELFEMTKRLSPREKSLLYRRVAQEKEGLAGSEEAA